MYFAVLILFRVKCWIGCPFSSIRSEGRGRLKYNFRPGWPLPDWLPSSSSCRSDSAPPDILFFSLEALFRCLRSRSDSRLSLLLLTVILRVAHRALCVVVASFRVSPFSPFVEDAMRAAGARDGGSGGECRGQTARSTQSLRQCCPGVAALSRRVRDRVGGQIGVARQLKQLGGV